MQDIVDTFYRLIPDGDTGTLQAVAALGSLGVTIVLAWITVHATNAARLSAQATQLSSDATQGMLKHQTEAAIAASRPAVVIDFHRGEPGGRPFYVASNVGPGAALNCYSLENLEAEKQTVLALGALLPGQQVVIPDSVKNRLDEQVKKFDKDVFYVVAEPVTGSEWVASVNRLDRNGRVAHEIRFPWAPPAALREEMRMTTLDEELAEAYDVHFKAKENTPEGGQQS